MLPMLGQPIDEKSSVATTTAKTSRYVPVSVTAMAAEKPVSAPPAPRVKSVRERMDPQLVAKARELRDRYLEHVNGERVNESPKAMIGPRGKYDVSRTLPAMSAVESSTAEGSRRLAAPDAARALLDAA
jgi:hypothetical protein